MTVRRRRLRKIKSGKDFSGDYEKGSNFFDTFSSEPSNWPIDTLVSNNYRTVQLPNYQGRGA